jgi:LPPG:FO 2-phospho-L-lactate transferase
MHSNAPVAVLSGGVGAARFLRGLLRVHDPAAVTAIVNVGDDVVLHGLAISPDLDTITYTLAEAIDPIRGWGLGGETWEAMGALRRYEGIRPTGSSAGGTWFSLGDRDLATHLYRTARRAEGAPLSTVTEEIAAAWGLRLHLLPVSDDRVETRLVVKDEGEVGFQEYFVGRHHDVPVQSVRFDGIEAAKPAPGVMAALDTAEVMVIAPSNPIVSIGPLLAFDDIRAVLTRRRARVVAISPIVAGSALKGPADHMMTELGHEASVVGVARLYRDVAAVLVIDDADAPLAPAVEAEGMRCVVTNTVMHDADAAGALARATLGAVEGLAS